MTHAAEHDKADKQGTAEVIWSGQEEKGHEKQHAHGAHHIATKAQQGATSEERKAKHGMAEHGKERNHNNTSTSRHGQAQQDTAENGI